MMTKVAESRQVIYHFKAYELKNSKIEFVSRSIQISPKYEELYKVVLKTLN